MKNSPPYIVSVALTLCIISALPRQSAPREEVPREKTRPCVVWYGGIDLMEEPSPASGLLARLDEGDALEFIEEKTGAVESFVLGGKAVTSGWIKVSKPGAETGWVPREAIRFGAALSPGQAGINEAVKAAPDGGGIYLFEGNYREALEIRGKKGLAIKGRTGARIAVDDPDKAVITIENSSGILIEGIGAFRLSEIPGNGDAVSVRNSADVVITKCDIAGPGGMCLSAEASDGVIISSSSLHDASRGCLGFVKCRDIRITGNLIYSNGGAKTPRCGDGAVISMKECRYAVIRNNTVTKNYGLAPLRIVKSKGIAAAKNIFFRNCLSPDFDALKVLHQGNYFIDPGFADIDADDFRLRSDSTLLDKGKAKAGALGPVP